MTTTEVKRLVEKLPLIRVMEGLAANEKADVIESYIPIALDKIFRDYDWQFVIKTADESLVEDQADYVLRGENDDCRDIVSILYGNTSYGWVPLDKKNLVDYDIWVEYRNPTGVELWIPSGYSDTGFPKVTLVATPTDDSYSIRYRYRRNDLQIDDFPDDFADVLIYGVALWLVPDYVRLYRDALSKMIERQEAGGADDQPAHLDPVIRERNRNRSGRMGW